MRDLDFGRQVVDYFRHLEWPEGVVVENLSCAAPLVLDRLQELRPAKVVLVGAVPRDFDPPATVRRYQVEASVEPSAMGFVDLDHTLTMARHWGGLPVDTTVIEVEPAEAGFGLGFSDVLSACLDPILDLVREELAGLAVAPPARVIDPPRTHRSEIPGVDVVGHLRSPGDWFDVVPLDDGLLGIVIGSDDGRGVEAAAAMSDLRAAAKAYMVIDGESPARLMRRLDRLAEVTGRAHQARLLYLTLHTDTGEVRYVNAGGCPPLLLVDGGPNALVVDDGRDEGTRQLAPGDTLLLASRAAGQERLRLAATAGREALRDLCAHLLATCEDDVSLVGVRLSPEARIPLLPDTVSALG